MASSASSIMSRCRATSMPIMKASDGSAPGPHAEHHPALGEVVEQHHAVGQHQRVVVGERARRRCRAGCAWCARPRCAMNTSGEAMIS